MDVVLLHGFLGSSEDWKEVIEHLGGRYQCHPLPLPLDLATFPMLLSQRGIEKCHLVGYSMGGRVALELYHLYPEQITHLTLLAAHIGLEDPVEKKARWAEDLCWIQMLKEYPLEFFLQKWYGAPLFQGFTPPARRGQIDPLFHAALLETHSLSKQTRRIPPKNTLLLAGEKDLKYQILYRTIGGAVVIKNAAHPLHLENPEGVAHAMDQYWQLHRHQVC